jgi:hypothetical protein
LPSIASFVTQRESELDRRGYVPQCANASSCCTGKQFRLWLGVPTVRNCLSSGQDCKLNDSSVCILRNLERPSERIEKRRVKVITIEPVQVHHPYKQQPIHNCLNCYQRQQLSLSFIGESKNPTGMPAEAHRHYKCPACGTHVIVPLCSIQSAYWQCIHCQRPNPHRNVQVCSASHE